MKLIIDKQTMDFDGYNFEVSMEIILTGDPEDANFEAAEVSNVRVGYLHEAHPILIKDPQKRDCWPEVVQSLIDSNLEKTLEQIEMENARDLEEVNKGWLGNGAAEAFGFPSIYTN